MVLHFITNDFNLIYVTIYEKWNHILVSVSNIVIHHFGVCFQKLMFSTMLNIMLIFVLIHTLLACIKTKLNSTVDTIIMRIRRKSKY